MTEHERAKAWRKKHGWTLDELAQLTGFSTSAVLWFERGRAPPSQGKPSRPINPYAWQRYRRVCHSVEVEQRSGRTFTW